jgi:lysozyme
MRALLIIAIICFAPAASADCPCQPDSQLLRTTRNFEGLRLFPYSDVAGHKTVGFGHMLRSGESYPHGITSTQAEALLESDETAAGNDVNGLVVVPLTQGKYDGLTDLTFNLGAGTLEKSTLLKRVNNGDDAKVPAAFMLYDKAHIGGKLTVLSGLFSRRKAEANMYAGGEK